VPVDISMMGEMPDDELDWLHDRWRRGDRDDRALFVELRGPMRRSAGAAIRRMTGYRPNPDDVDDAVVTAFRELLARDPQEIKTLVGLAARIALRRGQDVGRRLNRAREFPDTEVVEAEADDRTAADPEDEVLAAERAAERERIYVLAVECFAGLRPGQAEVVEATVLRGQGLADWAQQQGKSYQAAHKQRNKALDALLRCVNAKRRDLREGGDHVD
jgi:DNA-directed RNA polymerase specialized sigma24 family protein